MHVRFNYITGNFYDDPEIIDLAGATQIALIEYTRLSQGNVSRTFLSV